MIFRSLEDFQRFQSTFKSPVVFTNGCFDILHRGHIAYLNAASKLGDFLLIGLNSDCSIRKLKGPKRPINPQDERAYLLDNLKAVDGVIVFEEETPLKLIEAIKPNLYVKGGDYTKESLPETSLVENYGGSVQILPFIEGYSTSSWLQALP